MAHVTPTPNSLSVWLKKYWKTIAAVGGALATLVWSAYTSTNHHITPALWVQIATATATAVMVYVVPNIPTLPYVKTIAAAILGGLGIMTTYLAAGNSISQGQWVNILLAVVTGLGIHVVSNTGDHLAQQRALLAVPVASVAPAV